MTDQDLDVFSDAPVMIKPPALKRPLSHRAYFPWLVVLGILLILLAIFSPLVIVKAGHAGVATFMGEVQGEMYAPGAHLKYPLLRVHQFDTRELKYETELTVESDDLQLVTIDVTVNYSLNEAELQDLFREVGDDFVAVRLQPMVAEAVRVAAAEFTADELATGRNDFKASLSAELDNRLADSEFKLASVAVTQISFVKALQDAYTNQATAEQRLETAELDDQTAMIKAETETILSNDELERIRVIGEALRGNEAYIQYELLQKWDGKTPLYLAPTSSVQTVNDSKN